MGKRRLKATHSRAFGKSRKKSLWKKPRLPGLPSHKTPHCRTKVSQNRHIFLPRTVIRSGRSPWAHHNRDRPAPRSPRPEGRGQGELSKNGHIPFLEAPPGRAGFTVRHSRIRTLSSMGPQQRTLRQTLSAAHTTQVNDQKRHYDEGVYNFPCSHPYRLGRKQRDLKNSIVF